MATPWRLGQNAMSNQDLKPGGCHGWEEKDDHVTFSLVSVSGNKTVFGGLGYELITADQLRVELKLGQSDGSLNTEVFSFTRSAL